jgi:hypothetical protein
MHYEELHNLYSLPDNVKMIKSRRMRSVCHVERMGEMKNAYKILVENLNGIYYLGDLGED